MKACIYQKQTPVDIPQAETRTLKDVLELPWGFEIYSLLTRWNPLNLRRPLPKPNSGYRVLVVGMGPAGFTLAHHLLNEGHARGRHRRAEDRAAATKPSAASRADGARVPFEPVHDVRTLYEPLDERVMAGFGGVAEYGITVRWNKNFLKLVRLLLERRERFALIGGVRFGGTLTVDDAFSLGFDHVALAMGAGSPTTLDIPNGLARGVRTASDFLMALQLTGAARKPTPSPTCSCGCPWWSSAAASPRSTRRPSRSRTTWSRSRSSSPRHETLAAQTGRSRRPRRLERAKSQVDRRRVPRARAGDPRRARCAPRRRPRRAHRRAAAAMGRRHASPTASGSSTARPTR